MTEQSEDERTPEEKRKIGPATLGQAQQEKMPPEAPRVGTWPHATMPSDPPEEGADEPDFSPKPRTETDSGTVQRGGSEGERGQDDSVKSGDGVAG
jgi:hypothetical protein